jgi:hypothetical protein
MEALGVGSVSEVQPSYTSLEIPPLARQQVVSLFWVVPAARDQIASFGTEYTATAFHYGLVTCSSTRTFGCLAGLGNIALLRAWLRLTRQSGVSRGEQGEPGGGGYLRAGCGWPAAGPELGRS